MKKLKVFLMLLVCFATLCLVFASCKEDGFLSPPTKDGTIIFTNSSVYAEDDPVNVQLIQNSSVLSENSVSRNKSVTWKNLTPEQTYYIKVTDKEGRVRSSFYGEYLQFNETLRFKYDGSSVYREY